MILGPISGIDCIVFLALLAPQLILHAGFFPTLICGFQGLPFLRMFMYLSNSEYSYFKSIYTEIKSYSTTSTLLPLNNSDRGTCSDIMAVVKLPLNLLYDRLFLRFVHQNRGSSNQPASWFEDAVIQCIRYGFAYIPPTIARIFFSEQVALPLLRFRMLRHGYIRPLIQWRKVKQVQYELSYWGLMLTSRRMLFKASGSPKTTRKIQISWYIMFMVTTCD
jgi:hypothetical protein